MCQENDLEGTLGLLFEIVDDDLAGVMTPGKWHMESSSFVVAEVHWRHGLVTNKEVLQGDIAVLYASFGKARRGRWGLNEAIDFEGTQRWYGDVVIEAGGSVDRGDGERGRGTWMNKKQKEL